MIDTLEQAKEKLRNHWEKGTTCDCCGQRVQLYRRSLNSQQMIGLIALVRLYEKQEKYYHISELGRAATWGGEFARLKRWGMIDCQPNTDAAKGTSGMWKPTTFGIEFAKNKIKAPKYLYTFNKKNYGHGEEMVTVIEALGNKFNYSELMGYV